MIKTLRPFLVEITLTFIIVAAFSISIGAFASHASTTSTTPTVTPYTYQQFTFFSATTTSATSTNLTGGGGYLDIRGAKNVILYFSRGDTTGQGNTGSSKFMVQVSPNGTDWYYWGSWFENASSTVGFSSLTLTASTFTIPAGTSTLVETMNLNNTGGFLGLRCIVIETTDGEHTCKATATF